MKRVVVCALFIAAGCILVTGCVTQTNTSMISPSPTFTRFTVVGTEGSLRVSLEGSFTPDDVFIGEYPVYIDNTVHGNISTRKPITIIDTVGNHTVKVCCATICEYENVTIKFGKSQSVDFAEQLKKDLGSSKPAARITGYYPSAGQISIDVELINPTTQPIAISADVRCGYTYIETRNYNRIGSVAQGHLYEKVPACDRKTTTLNFNLASGSSYMYDTPTITFVST